MKTAVKPIVKTRTIIIEVKPVGSWQSAIRTALQLVNEYEGNDGLKISVIGTNLEMDFPNRHTKSCPELFEKLRLIPTIAKVYHQ